MKPKYFILAAFLGVFCAGGYFAWRTNNKTQNFQNVEEDVGYAQESSSASSAVAKAENESIDKSSDDQRGVVLKEKTKEEKVDKELSVLLNDTAIKQAWGLQKTDALRAWEVTHGSKKVVVAIIDTGIDASHPSLKDNLWVNPKEIPNNGIDDDLNGYIDDVNGWNFVENNSNLSDHHGHGTHIAGIVGAAGGKGPGVVGVSPKVSLMVLKYLDPKNPKADVLKSTVAAIKYAVANGADIINYSAGGTDFSGEERAAIEEARRKGVLFVAAAGNERSNSDQHKYYPADYGLENIISVTAIDQSVAVLPSSNYGVQTVDIAAPGLNILSTIPGQGFGVMTGTSQATAFVSGAAALLKSVHPDYKYNELKKNILATGDMDLGLLAKTRTARKLNLFKTISKLDEGLSLNGSKVANGSGVKSFTMDPNSALGVNGEDQLNQMNSFRKNMMRVLNSNGRVGEVHPEK